MPQGTPQVDKGQKRTRSQVYKVCSRSAKQHREMRTVAGLVAGRGGAETGEDEGHFRAPVGGGFPHPPTTAPLDFFSLSRKAFQNGR